MLKKDSTFFIVLIGIVSVFTNTDAFSQDVFRESNFSMILTGSMTKGHMNIGTEYDYAFGFGGRYHITDSFFAEFIFQTGMFTTSIDDNNFLDRWFKNKYSLVSIRSGINIVPIIWDDDNLSELSIFIGTGIILNDVETEIRNQIPGVFENYLGEDHNEPASLNKFGAQVGLNLTRSLVLFMEYSYFISSSDIIDGFRSRSELDIDKNRRSVDRWSSYTVGLRLRFWRKSTREQSAEIQVQDRLPGNIPFVIYIDIAQDNTGSANNAQRNGNIDHDESDFDIEDNMSQSNIDDDEVENDQEDASKTVLSSDILFDLNSSILRDEGKSALDDIILQILNKPDYLVSVVGHTCNLGEFDYNMWLSERRALSVMQYLIDSGVDLERINPEGRGETQPIIPNLDESSRLINRRVEIIVE